MPHRVLLVDDEEEFRFSAALILRMAGFSVTLGADGLEAISLILESQARNEPFDLLVTDIRMPRMSGIELIEGLRSRNISLPILVITGFSERPLLLKLAALGCPQFLEKPFESRVLVDRIKDILGGGKDLPDV